MLLACLLAVKLVLVFSSFNFTLRISSLIFFLLVVFTIFDETELIHDIEREEKKKEKKRKGKVLILRLFWKTQTNKLKASKLSAQQYVAR